jgi:ribulose bisphosphate carboxylase small subunit
MIYKVHTSLEGLRKWEWKKNLQGYFTIGDRELTDAEARKLVEFGLSKGYKTEADFTEDDLKELFNIE